MRARKDHFLKSEAMRTQENEEVEAARNLDRDHEKDTEEVEDGNTENAENVERVGVEVGVVVAQREGNIAAEERIAQAEAGQRARRNLEIATIGEKLE